jgi:hypothetical protein
LKDKNDGLKRNQSTGTNGDGEKEYTVIIAFDEEVLIACDEGSVNINS